MSGSFTVAGDQDQPTCLPLGPHRQGLPLRRRRDRHPYKRGKRRTLGTRKKLFNRHHAKIRALGERGAAALKSWYILREARCSPSRLTAVVAAILTLHHHAGGAWNQLGEISCSMQLHLALCWGARKIVG
ncbi:transposase family protein [Spirillospora sp. CA-255316]